MGKVIKIAKNKCICPTCDGNGYLRIATGDTSKDFRNNSEVHQCWDCESSGELEITEPSIEDLETSSRLQWLKIL